MKRFRFSVLSVMLATSLVALFAALVARPYLDERRSRQTTRAMENSGIPFNTERRNNMKLLVAGLGAPASAERSTNTPMWIQPLMNGLPARSDEIRELWLWDDAQVHAANDNRSNAPFG